MKVDQYMDKRDNILTEHAWAKQNKLNNVINDNPQ